MDFAYRVRTWHFPRYFQVAPSIKIFFSQKLARSTTPLNGFTGYKRSSTYLPRWFHSRNTANCCTVSEVFQLFFNTQTVRMYKTVKSTEKGREWERGRGGRKILYQLENATCMSLGNSPLKRRAAAKRGWEREREREGVWARALGGCITRAYNAIAGRLKRPLAWTGREKKRRITGGHVVLREQVHASATGVWTKLLLLLLLLGQFVRASRLEFRVARVLSTIVQQRTTWTTAQNYYVFHGFVIGSINGTEPTIRVYVRVCVHFPVWFYPRLARQCLGNCTNSSIYSLRQ